MFGIRTNLHVAGIGKVDVAFQGSEPMKHILFLAANIMLCFSSMAPAASPLLYHTHAVAKLEACVEGIRTMSLQLPNFQEDSRGRMPSPELNPEDSVQKISLRVLRVNDFEAKEKTVPPIVDGQVIEVTNPYLDQAPPFKPGDTIAVRLRLVLPEQHFAPEDPRQQWWFFPEGEAEGILAPRRPFVDVKIIR